MYEFHTLLLTFLYYLVKVCVYGKLAVEGDA